MRKKRVAVVDYGMGNLRSVEKALQKVGIGAFVTGAASDVRRADAVVLPGVGAFGEAVKRLHQERLWGPLNEALELGKPFLGICLGLQLLFERSEEARGAKGLGYFRGAVVKFSQQKSLKVPHMGWNTLIPGRAGKTPFLRGVKAEDYFYFVHSYFPAPKDDEWVASRTLYGKPFCSSMARGDLFASQFHPEKSGLQGQRVLNNFAQRIAAC